MSGCVSGATRRAIDEAERRLGAALELRGVSPARERSLGARSLEGGDCEALAAVAGRTATGLEGPIERARAAALRARAEGALPAPEVSFEVWDFPIGDPQRADREGMYMLGVGQEFPPAGALDGRARAEAEEALAELAELEERTRAIREIVHHACIDWSAAALRRERLARSAEVVERAIEVVLERRPVTGEPLSELARLELERARIARMRSDADADVERALATLAALIGGAPDGEPPPLVPAPDDADPDALAERAIASRGDIQARRARHRAALARADAADAEATIPTVTLQATWMQMPSMRAGLGAMVGVRLPWLWSGEGARSEAARAEARAEEDEIAWRARAIRIEIARAAASLRRALRRLQALRERERPAAERALESALVGYASGGADLTAWLEAVRALRELDVEEVEALAEAAHAHAEIASIVGAFAGAGSDAGSDAAHGHAELASIVGAPSGGGR